jgi:hypothetical protein
LANRWWVQRSGLPKPPLQSRHIETTYLCLHISTI